MIKDIFQNIMDGIDVRKNLSTLRQEIKEKNAKEQCYPLAINNTEKLILLLDNADAKTRKNAALLMGDLEIDEFCGPLFDGYFKETQLFVRSAYLTALKNYDCSPYIRPFKDQLLALTNQELTIENKKHIESEMRALSDLIVAAEGTSTHTFTGYHESYDCILLTNRLHKEVTEKQITHGTIHPFTAGVRVTTNDIEELLFIRTYSELLFVIPGMDICSVDPITAAKQIASSSLLEMLKKTHLEATPFYFRIGIKSNMPLDRKSIYTKKLSSELERLTHRELLNSTSAYELEIRMIENRMDSFNVLVKLNTILDDRFSYRKEFVAASIKPVNAALLVELAKDYMIPDAQVLDPFCGVGTMLIERQKVVKANTSYGIDSFAEAIAKAKINTEAAGQIIHFVNRNCFDFTHEYLFDEIFTNMPFVTGHKSEDEIYELYEQFFQKAPELLKEHGTIILYSHNRNFVKTLSKKQGYTIKREIEIMDKEGTWLFIILL